MDDQLQRTLDSLERDESFRVDAVLKASAHERTERVYFRGASGGEIGPFVRKTFQAQNGIGVAWGHVLAAEREGKRFIHLPRVIDCYEAGEDCVVIMECINGKTLDDEVCRRGPSLALAREFIPGACDAVSELHDSFSPPLIHRDIKPSNLMLSGTTVILIDLGIARAFNDEAVTDTVKFGTRGFAPPEQFGFGQTDARSDVYALGMLLFYLMTGKVPEPSSVEKVMLEHRVPRELRAVVLKAAAFDPAARYSSADELKRAALRAFSSVCPSGIDVVDAGRVTGGAAPAGVSGTNEPVPAGVSGASPVYIVGGDSLSGLPDAGAPRALSQGREVEASQQIAQSSMRFESFLRASVPFGRVWDVLIAATSALFLLVVILSCIFPNEEMSRIPPAARACEYLAMWLLLVSPSIALCDPRPLKRLLPRFAALGFLKRLVLMFVAAGISIVVIGVTNSVFVAH